MNSSEIFFNSSSMMNSSSTNQKPFANRQFIGIGLALTGNLFISISLSVQKKAHNRLGHENSTRYCFDRTWWLGMFLMILGETGNFLAYGFAPASMVAPLGSVAVIANTIIASLYLGEPLSMPSMMGVTLVVVGSILLISFSVVNRPMSTPDQIVKDIQSFSFISYISIEFVLLLALLFLKFHKKNEHLLVLILIVAIVASVTIILAKALSSMVAYFITHGTFSLLNPVFWISLFVLPITTVTQIRFLNRAMQLYDVSDVVPVNFIFFTLSAILAGTMFYQEFRGVSFDRIFMFMLGCFLSFMGVAIIMKQEKNMKSKENKEKQEPAGKDNRKTGQKVQGFSGSLAPSNQASSTSVITNEDANDIKTIKQKSLPTSNIISSERFFSRFVKLIKSNEKVTEVQPLVEDIKTF